MADSKSIIMELDTGKAITSVKEMKKYIEDLKGALLGLTEGTDEYNKEAKKLRDAQQKLNDVMYEAKKNSEGVEGSYDALVYKMRELKKQWRATADEAERANLGKQILSLNDSLKQLDSSVGDYKRSVGDYRNAWSEVFNSALGPLGKVGGKLGDLARQVKSLQPLIKQVNTTAVSGLKGITRAIASTGIGLLIIAVGELAAHWEDVWEWVQKNIVAQGDLNAAIEKNKQDTLELAKTLMATYKTETEEWRRLDALLAGEDMGRYAYRQRLLKVEQEHKQAVDAEGQAINNYNKAVSDREKAEKRVASLSALATDNARSAAEAELSRARATEEAAKKQMDASHKNTEQAVTNIKIVQGELQKYDAKVNQSANNTEAAGTKMKAAYDGVKASVEALMKRLDDYVKARGEGELWYLQGQLKDYKKQLESAFSKGLISKEALDESLKNLNTWYSDNYTKLLNDSTKELAEDMQKEFNGQVKEIDANMKNALERLDLQRKLQEHLKSFDPEKTFPQKIADSFNNIFGNQETIQKVFDKRKEAINENFEIERASAEEKIALYKDLIEGYEEIQADEQERYLTDSAYTSQFDVAKYEEYLEAKRELEQEEINLDNLKTQNFLDNADLEDERDEELLKARQARWQLMGTAISATSNIMKQFASMQEQQIKDDVANGKISEREGNKKFKRVKALQKAAAVMETAQAAMGAYSSLASIPYVGPALGIAAAAAAVAQGLMQIKQIDKTTLSSSSSSNLSTSTPDMNSVTNTYEPTYVTNMQTNTELSELANVVGSIQPVVKVTDINDAQNTVKVRDEENSF